MDVKDTPSPYLCPLVIGVTGHRDLLPSELKPLRAMISKLFTELGRHFPNTPLRVMSALAEGADRLVAQVALDMGIEVQAVLPMPASSYRDDFERPASKVEFDLLCSQMEVLELPVRTAQHRVLQGPGVDRDIAYANAGMFISAHCHILVALWDGVQSESVGGTSQIIYFQHYDRLPGIAESVPRTSLFLTDDESDLVYHVVCSRANASNTHSSQPLSACWFTADADAPRVQSLPERYKRVFHRMDEYNRDALRVLAQQDPVRSDQVELPPVRARIAAGCILRLFEMADALANTYQSRVHKTLAAVFALAVLTGLAFILYSEFDDMESSIYAFLGFLVLGIVLAGVARRRQWHRKYLDYRVLAEGLRVQYFWAIAGIHGEGHTKFAYDNFLRQRDMELGWIRNVMRVAGTPGDAEAATPGEAGLKFVIDNWIGSQKNPGQLQYYREKAGVRSRMQVVTEAITMGCLWAGIGVALVLAFFSAEIGDMRHALIVLMGVLPLIAGVAEVYTQRKADRELTKQYVFMEHVFANASRRIEQAGSDAEKREVLQGLGDAALSEHAEWILIHRERQPEPGGL